MPTPTTVDDFSLILGYPRTPVLNLGVALGFQNVDVNGNTVIPGNRLARCQELVVIILDIETKLTTARANSMAHILGSLNLNYGYHITELMEEGHRKLEELSAVLNMPIYFDRFYGSYPQAASFYSVYGKHISNTSPFSMYTPV